MNKTIYINTSAEAALKKIKKSAPKFNVSLFISLAIIDHAKKLGLNPKAK